MHRVSFAWPAAACTAVSTRAYAPVEAARVRCADTAVSTNRQAVIMQPDATRAIRGKDDIHALHDNRIRLRTERAHDALDTPQALRMPAPPVCIRPAPAGDAAPLRLHEGCSGEASAGLDATDAFARLSVPKIRMHQGSALDGPGAQGRIDLTTHGVRGVP